MISVYVEVSLQGNNFKPRSEYNVDWQQLIKISQECGMLSFSEKIDNNVCIKITNWAHQESYDMWLAHPDVQNYVRQRDFYNQQNHIINSLHIFPPIHENQNSSS